MLYKQGRAERGGGGGGGGGGGVKLLTTCSHSQNF
jgi:hypothetical protein